VSVPSEPLTAEVFPSAAAGRVLPGVAVDLDGPIPGMSWMAWWAGDERQLDLEVQFGNQPLQGVDPGS
jgi:hypothetical protein